jgi:uncharacterized protein (DUF1778 family)
MAKTRTAEGRTRIIATVDDELVAKIDHLAKIEGKSRSSLVEWMLADFVDDAEGVLIREHERRLLKLKIAEAVRLQGPDSNEAQKLSQDYYVEFGCDEDELWDPPTGQGQRR